MSNLILPEGYSSVIGVMENQRAIKNIKDYFQKELAFELKLLRVSAPLFVAPETGLNDNLNGVERTVSFTVKDIDEKPVEIVQSLAKWKRKALRDYDFNPGNGLYTDMNAIRRDEELDNLHSRYVDQWDWEKVIRAEDRKIEYLQGVVRSIVSSVCATEMTLRAMFPQWEQHPLLTHEVTFITSQQLEDLYPGLTPKEREDAICKEKKTVFLMQIGGKLKSGVPHDGRAPDYDDWELNGDLLFWSDTLNRSFELSSMGIRVTPESLAKQLELAGCPERAKLPFHAELLAGKLPLTIGGGIGQSRLCMLLLGSAHIGEVQSSVWDAATREMFQQAGIPLL